MACNGILILENVISPIFFCVYRTGPKPRMPVKAGGGAARAASEAGSGAAGDAVECAVAPQLPQPLRLKYSVGRIIGEFRRPENRQCRS